MSVYIASLDLGQINDYAALVITQARGTPAKFTVTEPDPEIGLLRDVDRYVETMPLTQLDVIHAERFPLGTRYAVVASEMKKRIEKIPKPRYFVIDQTGVGQGAIELFTYLAPVGIVFTAGNEETQRHDPHVQMGFNVPKRNLVSSAQVLLQNHVMKIAADLDFAAVLGKELQAFKMKISLAGHDTYEAWRERDHDDLVNALAMACWLSNWIISTQALGDLGRGRWEEPPGVSPY